MLRRKYYSPEFLFIDEIIISGYNKKRLLIKYDYKQYMGET